MGVGSQRHATAAFSPVKTRYRRLDGPQIGLDGCGKSRPPPGFDPLTVQPVAQSLYRLSYPGSLTT